MDGAYALARGTAGNRGCRFDLIAKVKSCAGHINAVVTGAVGALVHSMNCYYSNLIEGQHMHPHDIDRALHREYSTEPRCRALQLKAVAHIEAQQGIDDGLETTLLCQI